MGAPSELTVSDLGELGARRISVGGALARAAWGGFMRTAKLIAEPGSFKGFADAAPGAEIVKGLARLSDGATGSTLSTRPTARLPCEFAAAGP